MTEQYQEQIAFPNQSRYYQEPRPARKIPTQQQIEAAARRQAQYEAAIQEADLSYSGHYAGLHTAQKPFISTDLSHISRGGKAATTRAPVTVDNDADYDLEEDDSYYTTRPHTSTRRYATKQGSVNVVEHYHEKPLRAHRPQLPPPRYSEEDEHIPYQSQRRMHPLLWLGIFGILLVLGWFGLNFVTVWYQGVQNDWTYGKDRHFEINAVVGHGDSQTNPSHFTAENNNGQIIVIELPGNNVSKAKIYQIETVPGNTGNPPVKLSFQDMNGDGKPDMLVQIGDGEAMFYVTLFNNGSQFVSKL